MTGMIFQLIVIFFVGAIILAIVYLLSRKKSGKNKIAITIDNEFDFNFSILEIRNASLSMGESDHSSITEDSIMNDTILSIGEYNEIDDFFGVKPEFEKFY